MGEDRVIEWTDAEKLRTLLQLITAQGFEVQYLEQGFYMTNGEWTPYYLKPIDPKTIAKAVIRAIDNNNKETNA